MAALAIPIEVQEQSLSQSTVILQVKFGLLGDSRLQVEPGAVWLGIPCDVLRAHVGEGAGPASVWDFPRAAAQARQECALRGHCPARRSVIQCS